MLQIARAMTSAVWGALLVAWVTAAAAPQEPSVGWLLEETLEKEFLPLFEAEIAGPRQVKQALAFYHAGDYRAAAHLLEGVRRLKLPDGNLDFVTFALAECYRELGLQEHAADEYDFVVENFAGSNKTAPSYYRLLEYAYEEKNEGLADSLFMIFSSRYQAHPLYSSVLYVMGKLYFRMGRFGEGYQVLTQVPKSSSRHVQAQFLAALCYVELKEWEKALLLLQYVSKRTTDPAMRSEATIVIGDIYFVRGNVDAAMQFYRGVPRDAARYPYVRLKIARAYLDMEKFESARDIAEEFVHENPGSEYYFEMATLLEQAYSRLGEESKATAINAMIFRQLTNARLSFEIYDELDRISTLIRNWQVLKFQAARGGNTATQTKAKEQIARLGALKKEHQTLLTTLGLAREQRGKEALAGASERRYLTLLRDSMLAVEDSILDVKGELELLTYESKSKGDSALSEKIAATGRHLQRLEETYGAYEREYAVVVDECLGSDLGDDVSAEEDRQAQFVDWSFIKYQARKQERAQLSREAMERGATTDTTDTLAQKGKEVVQLFSAIEYDKVKQALFRDRERLISHIRTLLDMYPKSRYNPQLLMRLAELYYDKASDEFDVKLRAYEEQMAKGDEGDTLEFPEYDLSAVVRLYDRIVAEYPRAPLADDAIYYKALALQKVGREAEANDLLISLTEDYPESEYFVEANMNIGRYFFEHPKIRNQKGYELAEEAFRKVLYYRDHPQFVQALYHLGWCYYMQDQYEEAIAVFKYLVEEVDLDFDPSRMEDNQIVNPLLREEAIDYIAISFDEKGRGEEALTFLKLIGNNDYASLVLKRIGELREEVLDYNAAMAMYDRLIEEYPLSIGAPDATVNIIKILETTGKTEEALRRREAFFTSYSRGSEWQEAVAKVDSGRVRRVDSMAIAIGLYVGDAYYRRAEKSGSTEEFKRASQNYRELVTTYPENLRAAEARWNLAVILETKLKKPVPAYGHYIAYSRLEGVEGKRREQAALNAIAIAQRQQPPDTVAEKGRLDVAAAKLIEAVDNYVELFPEGASTGEVLLTEGAIFFNREMFSNAAEIYQQVLDMGPETKEYYRAVFLLGQCRFGEENWLAAAQLYKKVWKESPKEEERKKAHKLLLQSLFHNAELLVESEDHEKAAKALLAIEEEYPGSEYSDIVLFNAAEAFEKLKEWDKACESYFELVRKYPGSKLAPDALFNAASDYEKTGDFEEAAEAYEQLVSQYPKAEKAKDGLFNLGFCYEKLGQFDKMAAANERYSRMYPGEKDVEIMLLRSANYYFKADMYKKAVDVYRSFVSRFPQKPRVVEAYVMVGRSFLEQDDEANALMNFQEAEKANQRLIKAGNEGDNYFAAEGAYYTGEIYRGRFEQITLTLPVKSLKAKQKRKSETLAKAAKAYTRVMQYQAERMFEAGFLIGKMYDQLAQTWFDQERPRLSPVKAAVKEKDVALVASSLLKKALVPYEKVLELATELDSLSADQQKWITKARENLASDYYQAGEYMLAGISAMHKAPIPKEIREKPVHFFQYLKQLFETLEPMKAEARDYFLSAYRKLNELGLEGTESEMCLSQFSRLNFMLGNDYDKLATRILKSTNALPDDMDEIEREDIIFQLEDIVFELQDKAIFSYEDAMALAKQEGVQGDEWYGKIMESLARLSPETYGKSFYHTVRSSSDGSWIVRSDSVAGWNTGNIPAEGWQGVRVLKKKRVSGFGKGQPRVIWGSDSAATTYYFWKHVFLEGYPRGAAVYVSASCPYELYVNGSATLADTGGNKVGARIDSATGIVSLVKGGDNVIACQIDATDSSAGGLAVVFSAMIDTTQKFESALQPPKVALALKERASEKKHKGEEAAKETDREEGEEGTESYRDQYKNRGELLQAIEEYKVREEKVLQQMRKERLKLQKARIKVNALDVQMRMMEQEIEAAKKALEEMEREK